MASDKVILLHGLMRHKGSMGKLEKRLSAAGFEVVNIGYPSRTAPVEELAAQVKAEIDARTEPGDRLSVVTHSMGGIIVRFLQSEMPVENLHRVVMISPPNQGSEIVDKLGGLWLFGAINGPAGRQLGTGQNGLPGQLGPVDFELGVITGDRSINPILSCLIPGRDDGKVSVESAQVDGMADFKVVHATHTFIQRNRGVIDDTIHFLRHGRFSPD